MENVFANLRQEMVEKQLKIRGIKDKRILKSFLEVPRHLFVPEKIQQYAYEDSPLLISEGQTISQPYIVALMCESAKCKPSDSVLDIGTGSGYAAAILSRLVKEVHTIERIPSLSESAQKIFQQLNYENIFSKIGDGTLGWPEHAPYDAIIVTAGAPVVPHSLLNQLVDGGRLVIPVGDSGFQCLMRYTKKPDGTFHEERLQYVRFVPLIGEQGW